MNMSKIQEEREFLLNILEYNTGLLCNYVNSIVFPNRKSNNLENILSQCNVMVALSGGGDSVGLLSLFAQIKKKYPSMCLTAGYVNHYIQDTKEQIHELQVVEQVCDMLIVPLVVSIKNDNTERTDESTGGELEARIFRYRELIKLAHKVQADYIITAHHIEDQFETLHMRIFQGQGISGLTAIPNIRFLEESPPLFVMRPCLYSPTMERIFYKWCTEHVKRSPKKPSLRLRSISSRELNNEVSFRKLPIHNDISNASLQNTRSVVRTVITPEIIRNFPHAIDKTVYISDELLQFTKDFGKIASEHVWGIDSMHLGHSVRLHMATIVFEKLSYSMRKIVLYQALNMLGISQLSASFLTPLLIPSVFTRIFSEDNDNTRPNLPMTMYIEDICIQVSQKNIVLYKDCKAPVSILDNIKMEIAVNEKIVQIVPVKLHSDMEQLQFYLSKTRDNTDLQISVEICKSNSLPADTSENEISVEDYFGCEGVYYDMYVKGDLYIDFLTKHDTIFKNNCLINIRSILVKQLSVESWNRIPVLRDSDGVLAVLGEVLNGSTIMRQYVLENTTASEEYTHVCVCVQHEKVLVWVN